jgi:signal transduction histidine kinase
VERTGDRSRRALVCDAAVVLAAVGLSADGGLGRSSIIKPYGGATAVVLVAVALSLVFRRRAPSAVAWVVAGAAAVLPIVELIAPGTLVRHGADTATLWWPPAAPFAAYAVMAFGRNRVTAWIPVPALLAVAVAAVSVLPEVPVAPAQQTSSSAALAYRATFSIAGGALLGLYVFARRRTLQMLTDRAERAEREQHLLAEQARAEERTRLAAEMHDVITHRVSLMVLQAGALRVRARDEETRATAEDLRATGCAALGELRDAIGLLRTTATGGNGPAEAGPVPFPGFAPLIADSQSVGVMVRLTEEGHPPLVSPVIARTAYRVVQEALTNVRKHATGADAEVWVRYRAEGVHLTVRNTAPAQGADGIPMIEGSGTGLLGLRHRVELIGGTLLAGPSEDGGFRVEARLPAYVPEPEPAR